MTKIYTTSLTVNNAQRQVSSAVSEDELASAGLQAFAAWNAALREPDPIARAGIYLNLVAACREVGRHRDALRILHRAVREIPMLRQLFTEGLRELSRRVPPDDSALPPNWRIVHGWSDPSSFNEAIGHQGELYCNYMHPGAPYGGILGRPGLFNQGADQGLQNLSFHVFEGAIRIATVALVAGPQHILGGVVNHPSAGNLPARIHFAADAYATPENVKAIVEHILAVGRLAGIDSVLLGEDFAPELALMHSLPPGSRYAAEVWSSPVLDLRHSQAEIAQDIRKSYRSLINWGRKNLQLQYWSGPELDDTTIRDLVKIMEDLKSEVYARYGSGATAELYLYPMLACRAAEGEVSVARMADGEIVGFSVTTDLDGVAYYALGAYSKGATKSAAHFMLHDAIVRAKARGNARYVLSRPFPAPLSTTRTVPEHLFARFQNIEFFKAGFSKRREHLVVYSIDVRDRTPAS
jgi:hypothetical protein